MSPSAPSGDVAVQSPEVLERYLKRRRPLTSVVSYADRGPWGDNRYPGNCSGYLLIDLIATFQPRSVLDPMEGSGTSREVCADMQVPYTGYDLQSGTDSLRDPIEGRFDLVFWHPPYHDMKRYSNDERDMSAAPDVPRFLSLLRHGYERFFGMLAPGGRLAILMGDMRRRGRYEPLTMDVARLDRAHLEGIIIKIQHNVSSNTIRYTGPFVPILHETLTIYRRQPA